MFYVQTKVVAGSGEAVDDSTTPFSLICANTTNATLVKAGRGVIVSMHVVNTNAAARYLKFYDTNKVPTAGVGTPCRRYMIPGNTAGAGFVLAPMLPLKFLVGIAFTLVTGVADTDATAPSANDVVLTLESI
jgi:hypothetical protein